MVKRTADAGTGRTAGTATRRKAVKKADAPSSPEPVDRLKEIGVVAYFVWIAVSALSLAGPSILVKALEPKAIDRHQVEELWHVFALTAPFTLAVAVVAVVWWRDSVAEMWLIPFVAIVLSATTFVANWLGSQTGAEIDVLGEWSRGQYNFPRALARMVVLYAYRYGWRQLLSSVILGGFMAWIWSEQLLGQPTARAGTSAAAAP
jgi:hypothetical protein